MKLANGSLRCWKRAGHRDRAREQRGRSMQFGIGRQFAAWLGLTPMQRSSGGKTKLGGITKRGDTYLRAMRV
jgi:transposase